MNLTEVHRVLSDFYQKELTHGRKRHLVFWYDEACEFVDEFAEIDLPGVRKWIITEHNLFATMYELEKKDPESHFLLYANRPKPSPREDWLYDQFILGHEFATDKTTVIMRELGVSDDTLREKFQTYQAFFNSRARRQAFRKYPIYQYTHEIVDLTVLAALTKSPTNTLDEIVKALLRDLAEGSKQGWDAIEKWASPNVFWELVEKVYGYALPEKSLQSLLISFMVTYVSQYGQGITLPKTWQAYLSTRPENVVVFMDHWMHHREDREVYNVLADHVADTIRAAHYASEWDPVALLPLDAFRVFDEQIMSYLATQLTHNLTDFETYSDMIAARRKCHWYPEFASEYEAIFQATQLCRLLHDVDHFIPEQAASDLFTHYAVDYYRIDAAYRKFYAAYDRIAMKERVHALREHVENLYSNGFMPELALKWMTGLQKAQASGWPLTGIAQQQDFYDYWVQPYVANGERVFVIISDALRYEVAMELKDALNHERKASTEMTVMQSVLPSFTSLGMAALLPHKQLTYTDEGDVLVDGASSNGVVQRNAILQNRVSDAVALSVSDVADMNRQTLRKTIQGKKVIYLYHNAIDARGDHPATEAEVFQAAEEGIKDVRQLVNQLVNNVSASNIVITADHGFLYQRDAIMASQKIPQTGDPAHLTKRRYMITKKPQAMEGTLMYPLDHLQSEQGQALFVTVPKGVNRFAIQGAGANFVHGGAMLQEIVLPVINFKNDRSKSTANIVKKVDVKLTTPTRKVTNNITYLTFLQTERVEKKNRPWRLRAYFVDEDGVRVSNENIMIADRVSSQPGERTFREKFVFKVLDYDKRKTYYLILEDEAEQAGGIYERYPFTIDIAFSERSNVYDP